MIITLPIIGISNTRNRRRNNAKTSVPRNSANDPNDSDASSLSSTSFPQVHEHMCTGKSKGSQKRKQDIENVQLSAPKRTPTTDRAQSNVRPAHGKSLGPQAPSNSLDQAESAVPSGTPLMPPTPSPNQVS